MTENKSPIALQCERVITHLVLGFTVPPGRCQLDNIHRECQAVRLGALAQAIGFEIKQDARELPIWKNAKPFLDGRYFYPYLQSIFGLFDQAQDALNKNSAIRSLPALELDTEAINVLSGRFGAKGKGLCVKLGKRSVHRLAEAGIVPDKVNSEQGEIPVLRFDVASVKALFFGTGVGMLVIELGYDRTAAEDFVSADSVLEINNLLARCDLVEHAGEAGRIGIFEFLQEPAVVGLGAIVTTLLGPPVSSGGVVRYRAFHWNKAFSFTQVRMTKTLEPEERWLLCHRLACKETSDYYPLPDLLEALYRPFAAITHLATQEGGTVLVEPTTQSQDVEFLHHFVGNSGSRAYLPLALWAFHDYMALSGFMTDTYGLVDFEAAGEKDINALKNFRNRIYNFRFHFRFSLASTVTMHNVMYRRWRTAFYLHSLLDEVGQDVTETENYLESDRSERRNEEERRNNFRLTIAIAFVGVVVALPGWTEIGLFEAFPILAEPPWRGRVAVIQACILFGMIAFSMGWILRRFWLGRNRNQ